MQEDREYKYLGYENGWAEIGIPDEYKNCRKAKHTIIEKKIGRCETQFICNECRITWKCDSSD